MKVDLSKEAAEVYDDLNRIAGHEIKKGTKGTVHQSILRSIKRALGLLKDNPFAGDIISRKLIPKILIKKYGIKNLWRIELSNYWRLLYTINSPSEIEILNFVLKIIDHKDYNKLFGYKKK